tara:strand:+ start:413 stop:1417 length:1005 start_codon:yes stop_codon:yes gene_type:complete
MRILVTGGAGFIGKALIIKLLSNPQNEIYNLDKLTYASDLVEIDNFIKFKNLKNYKFLKVDLSNKSQTSEAIKIANPDLIIHLAAESHVDRSITNPFIFIKSNIVGTYNLLEAALIHFQELKAKRKEIFKFHHISTDEVFGTLGDNGKFSEISQYDPRSPYSASKASSDHLVRAWFHTYNLPVLITNCSNNYGPGQFKEKFIPTIINNVINKKEIPIYGNGLNKRDWLYIDDHIEAILKVCGNAKSGETFCIGGYGEMSNIDVAKKICDLIDKKLSRSYSSQKYISFVKDRPGHDKRYSIDSSKIEECLNWRPKFSFDDGLNLTIDYYLKKIDN